MKGPKYSQALEEREEERKLKRSSYFWKDFNNRTFVTINLKMEDLELLN